jgi:predicted RNA-binding Zn-ribbon protein involved in translation (DUF1610 family)
MIGEISHPMIMALVFRAFFQAGWTEYSVGLITDLQPQSPDMEDRTAMDSVKVYIVGKEKVDVACPSCGRAKIILLADTDTSRNREMECPCGNTILLIFEKRRAIRSRILLTGTCFSRNDPSGGTTIKILNLSRTGMLFLKETGGKLEPDETIRLRFRPKPHDSVIRCAALVRNIDGDSVGAKFLYLDSNAQKLIGSCIRA